MMRERFNALVQELRAHLISAPNSAYDNVSITIDGVNFSLNHSGEKSDQNMTLFCDFGKAPDSTRAGIIKALLKANAAVIGRAGRESFAMNPVSGHILATSILPMAKFSQASLDALLKNYAQQAQMWRTKYALQAAPPLLAA